MLVLPLLLVAVALLLVVLYAQFRWKNKQILSTAAKLPCPPALPLLGNALFFTGGICSVTKNIIAFTTKFKKLFCIWVGPVPVFVVSDPSDAQIILNSSNTLEKDDIYMFLKPFLGNGLLTAPVHMWKKYRRLLSPVLHPGNVEKFLPVFNDISKQLVDKLSIHKSVVDPRKDIFDASMDAIMRTAISRNPLDSQTKLNVQFLLNSVGRMFTYRLFKVWLHIDFIFNLLYKKQLEAAIKTMAECIEVFNKEWEDEENTRNAIPESARELERTTGKSMIDVCFSNPPSPDSPEEHEWRDEVVTMIVGATDTVVAALGFVLVTLANNPAVQKKVYEEIHEIMEDTDRDVTLQDLNSMTYLGQVLMESMRIHGTFPVILRKATKETKLSSSVLPAGSRILVPLHAMGLDAHQFPHPEKFLPERFSQESQQEGETKRHNYAFLPFSGGPRNCLGKIYAMHLMKIVLVHILRKYDISTEVRLEDIEYELKVVMFSRTPLLLKFDPRVQITA